MASATFADDAAANQEENDFIRENLDHFNKFFSRLKMREESWPHESTDMLRRFKDNWVPYFVGDRPVKRNGKAEKRDSPGIVTDEYTGAISKGHVRLPSDKSTAGSISDTSGDKSEDSSKEEVRQPTRSGRSRKTAQLDRLNIDGWRDVLEKLDGRKVPALEKYDEDSGLPLKKYFVKFEAYCKGNFRGNRDSWIGELEKHLQGKTLKAFESLRDVDDSYEDLKAKICQWHEDMRDLRKEKNRQLFKKARRDPEESMFLFSSRLQRLFKLAYPRKSSSTSKELRDKYISSVPKKFAGLLKSQIMIDDLQNERPTRDLQNAAEVCSAL